MEHFFKRTTEKYETLLILRNLRTSKDKFLIKLTRVKKTSINWFKKIPRMYLK